MHVFDRLCSYNIFSFLCKCFHSWETSWITQPLEGHDPCRAQRDDQRRVVGEDGGGPTQAKQMIIGFEDVCASVLRVIYSGTQTTPSTRGEITWAMGCPLLV